MITLQTQQILQKTDNYLQHLKGKKVAMLVSGGVDSAVALALLKSVGADVKGFYLKIWLEDEVRFLGGDCPWEEDVEIVEEICEKLDIEYEILPLQKEYFDKVVAYTISEVEKGRTPNPDVMCNSKIKFGSFLDKIKEYEFDYIASGHYALKSDKGLDLRVSADAFKDQTYFLSNLKPKQLDNLIFPIGCLDKSEVRLLADYFDLANKNRKDSQGICFLGKLKFSEFVKHYLGTKTGDIVDFDTAQKIGTHEGFYFYTLGQRKGLGLAGGPWYVVKKDVVNNIIYISKEYFDEKKERDEFWVEDLNMFKLDDEIKIGTKVKIRHGEKMYKIKNIRIESDKINIKIDSHDQGIATGQFAVFYNDDRCIGSGVICEN